MTPARALVIFCALAVGVPGAAAAPRSGATDGGAGPKALPANAAARGERVPLADGFPLAERWALGAIAATDLVLLGLQHTVLSDRAPRVSEPPAFDRRVSDRLYRGLGAKPWLGGVPDALGAVGAPALAGLFYFTDAALLWRRGAGFAGDLNADHELLTLFEALAVNMLFNQSTKLLVGRLRPEYALDRREGDDPSGDPEASVSFYSMHSSASFCLAAFVSRDLGDWIAGERLAASSPARRFVLARLLPGAALYGAASVIALSRVVDQKHYLSDVTVGAVIGAAIGNFVYAAHFDGAGRVRRAPWRFGWLVAPGGLALQGTF